MMFPSALFRRRKKTLSSLILFTPFFVLAIFPLIYHAFLGKHYENEVNKVATLALMRHTIEYPKSTLDDLSEKEDSCAVKRPTDKDILWSNRYWQVIEEVNNDKESLKPAKTTKYYIYGAYLDTRRKLDGATVRILVIAEHAIGQRHPGFCRFWSKTGGTIQTKVVKIDYLWYSNWGEWGNMHPYLVSCKVPRPHSKLATDNELRDNESNWDSVSLTINKCESVSNDVKISYEQPENGSKQKSFAVCVKGLSYPLNLPELERKQISRRYIEWIEMLRILGVDTIHFYIFNVPPEVKQVLEHYNQLNVVVIKDITLPGSQPFSPSATYNYLQGNPGKAWKQELIFYNDCFLENMYKYHYIVVLDIDEVILPMKVLDWNAMMRNLHEENQDIYSAGFPSFCFEMKLFVNQIEDSIHKNIISSVKGSAALTDLDTPFMMTRLHFVRHPQIAQTISGGGSRSYKCIHHTTNVLAVHNHFARLCLEGIMTDCTLWISPNEAYVHHHRERCCDTVYFKQGVKQEAVFKSDDRILMYKEELERRRDAVVMQIFNENS